MPKGAGRVEERRCYIADAGACKNVPVHSAADTEPTATYLRKLARETERKEGQYFCSRRDGRVDGADAPPTRAGQRSPFVYPPCRPSCQSRNDAARFRDPDDDDDDDDDDIYVASRAARNVTIIAHSAESRPETRSAPSSLPFLLLLVIVVVGGDSCWTRHVHDDSLLLFQEPRKQTRDSASSRRVGPCPGRSSNRPRRLLARTCAAPDRRRRISIPRVQSVT